MTNDEAAPPFRHSGFVIDSGFWFRHSGFNAAFLLPLRPFSRNNSPMTRTLLTCAAAAILLTLSFATAAAIPPDADGAEKALAASPRHGEYVDIAMPGSDT